MKTSVELLQQLTNSRDADTDAHMHAHLNACSTDIRNVGYHHPSPQRLLEAQMNRTQSNPKSEPGTAHLHAWNSENYLALERIRVANAARATLALDVELDRKQRRRDRRDSAERRDRRQPGYDY